MQDSDGLQKSVNQAIARCSELMGGAAKPDPKSLEEIKVALGSLTRIKTRLAGGPLPPKTHRLRRYTIFIKVNNGAHALPGDLRDLITRIEEQYSRRR